MQIGRVEAFGEPAVNRREKVAGFGAPVLLAPQPGSARGQPQFKKAGALAACDVEPLFDGLFKRAVRCGLSASWRVPNGRLHRSRSRGHPGGGGDWLGYAIVLHSTRKSGSLCIAWRLSWH